jgi:predicted PhzF superfamily epimerase YddE/YHI9
MARGPCRPAVSLHQKMGFAMELPLYQIDAFTDRLFAGNPAGVVPLTRALPDKTLQSIAFENNLPETAFFLPEGEGYRLRWFTPTVEVDLCGHATLATAFVIAKFLDPDRREMSFETRSGRLTVSRQGDVFVLDFPVRKISPVDEPSVGRALGRKPSAVLKSFAYLAVFDSWDDVAALEPDLPAVASLGTLGVMASAPGREGIDYVSRFFAPGAGIPEDPATGSAHCALMPYWAERLGRKRLVSRQISARGGDFECELVGDRVRIGGRAVCYLKGSVAVDS